MSLSLSANNSIQSVPSRRPSWRLNTNHLGSCAQVKVEEVLVLAGPYVAQHPVYPIMPIAGHLALYLAEDASNCARVGPIRHHLYCSDLFLNPYLENKAEFFPGQ